MGVFMGGYPADRGFMHADIFGHIMEDKRFEVARTFFKKIVLKFEQTLHDLVDGSLALLQGFDKPLGTAFFLLQISPGFLIQLFFLFDQFLILA